MSTNRLDELVEYLKRAKETNRKVDDSTLYAIVIELAQEIKQLKERPVYYGESENP